MLRCADVTGKCRSVGLTISAGGLIWRHPTMILQDILSRRLPALRQYSTLHDTRLRHRQNQYSTELTTKRLRDFFLALPSPKVCNDNVRQRPSACGRGDHYRERRQRCILGKSDHVGHDFFTRSGGARSVQITTSPSQSPHDNPHASCRS